MIDWIAVGKASIWISGLAVMLTAWGWATWLAAYRSMRLRKVLAIRSVQACFEVGLLIFSTGMWVSASSLLQRVLWTAFLLCFAADRLLASRAPGAAVQMETLAASDPPRRGYAVSRAWHRAAERVASAEPLLILAVAPFLIFPNRFTVPLALLLALPWLARKLLRGRFTARTPLDAPLALLLGMLLISLWAAVDLQLSAPKLFGIILGMAVFYGVVNFARSTERASIVAAALVAIGAGIATLSLLGTDWTQYVQTKLFRLPQVYASLPRLIRGVPGVKGVGFHPNEVAAALCLFVPYAYALLLLGFSGEDKPAGTGTSRWGWSRYVLRALLLLALLLITGTLLLTQSRSALAGVGIGLLVVMAFRRRLLGPALAAGLLAVAVVWRQTGPEQVSTMVLQALIEADVRRVEIWQRALLAIADFPYGGVGLNHFPMAINLLYPLLNTAPERVLELAHAHNAFLQVAVDLGIPGLVAYLALLLGFAFAFRTAYRRLPTQSLRAVSVGLLGGMLAYHVYGLTDCMTLGAKPGVAIWAMWGLMAALANLAVLDEAAAPVGAEDQGEARPVGLA